MLEISPYPTIIQLKYILVGIHHCVAVVSKWISDNNFTFAPRLAKDNLDFLCVNNNETKLRNGLKGVFCIN